MVHLVLKYILLFFSVITNFYRWADQVILVFVCKMAYILYSILISSFQFAIIGAFIYFVGLNIYFLKKFLIIYYTKNKFQCHPGPLKRESKHSIILLNRFVQAILHFLRSGVALELTSIISLEQLFLWAFLLWAQHV